MKQILRMFAIVGVVLLVASITALSCNDAAKKLADQLKDNNNSGGNGGTGGGLCSTNANAATTLNDKIVVTVTDAGKSVVTICPDGTIKMLASKFPTTVAATATDTMKPVIGHTDPATRIEVFTVKFKDATGGMMFAVSGNKTKASDITTYGTSQDIPDDARSEDGVFMVPYVNKGTVKQAFNIVSVFARKNAPANAAEAAANVSPFAFTASTTTGKGTQPVLWCVASFPRNDASTKLTGGQEAKCYIASVGASALGTATTATDWLSQTGNFKKAIKVSFAGIRTDDTTLDNLGIGDGQALFQAGLSGAQVGTIVTTVGGADRFALSTYTIEIISDP